MAVTATKSRRMGSDLEADLVNVVTMAQIADQLVSDAICEMTFVDDEDGTGLNRQRADLILSRCVTSQI